MSDISKPISQLQRPKNNRKFNKTFIKKTPTWGKIPLESHLPDSSSSSSSIFQHFGGNMADTFIFTIAETVTFLGFVYLAHNLRFSYADCV